MSLIIMSLITIACIVVIVWALVKLVEKVYNIISIVNLKRHPDVTKQKRGIAYNKKYHRLEADQSIITPF